MLVHDAVEQRPVVRRPNRVAERVLQGVRQHRAGCEVLDEYGEALGAAGVGAVRQITAVVADRECAEVEVLVSFGECGLVEHRLRRIRRVCRPARPGPVLAAGREPPLVVVIPVLDGHRLVVRLLPRLDLFEQRLRERLVGCHDRVEVAVLGFEIGDHVSVVDGRIALVPEPVIGVLDLDPVVGVGVGPLFGHRRRVDFRHVGGLVAPSRQSADQRRRKARRQPCKVVLQCSCFRR